MKPGFRILALLLFLFAISRDAYNQSNYFDQQLKMPQVVPASPDAAGIEKFGNIPVSYATGVPDISIPIWTIKCGNLSWPVSLSYHAGGIRVDESASNAGLGWAVNGQGAITRSRNGRPDEEAGIAEPNYSSVTDNDDVYLYGVLDGTRDSEQDIFNFNFNGRSGKFVIDQDGSVFQIPLSDLKITYAGGLSSFTITDENGVVYLFNEKEITNSRNAPSESTSTFYTSSWYLTKVELPDKKNTIQFTYAPAGSSNELYNNFTQAVGEKYIEVGNGAPTLSNRTSDRSSSSTIVQVGIMKLTDITFPNGSVVFTYDASARQDIGATNNVTNKLSTISVNEIVNSVSIQAKKFSFYQSYFYYNPAGAVYSPNQYRLRLDSLSESGISDEPLPKKYKFEYNTTPIVPRGHYGQDIWGYNNGILTNPSLLKSQNVTFSNGSYSLSYAIGDANRNVDIDKMKACMLSAITYPTGGKTAFSFEPHVYNTDLTVTSTSQYETHTSGDLPSPQVSTTTFTYPSTAVPLSARLIVDMSMYNFTGVTNPSVVSLKDLTTGVSLYVLSQPYPNQRYTSDQSISLQSGHNYELKANVYSSTFNSQLTAGIQVKWSVSTTQPDIRMGGGLRIKEMIHYTDNNKVAGKESYAYDTAVTLSPFYLIDRTYSDVFYRLGHPGQMQGDPICGFFPSPLCRVYHSGSVYAMSTAMGSPMLYRRVQKITIDAATGAVNGKSEYLYDVFRDETFPVGGQYTLIPLLTNDWKNGFLISETHYKFNNGQYSIVKKTENSYGHFADEQSTSLRVQAKIIREGCSPIANASTVSTDILYYPFPIRSGSKRLAQQIVTQFDDNQNKIETVTTNYYMSNKYDFPTKTMVIDSKGSQDSVTFKHPTDFSSPGNVYEKMEQRNIIAPVIEQKSYNNATLLNTVKSNYRDWYGDGKIIALDSVQASVLNNTLETRLKYYGYDTYNNPVCVSKSKDIQVSYIWGYQSSYPIAEVINSDNNSIAYTSFEADAAGGWTIGSILRYADYITGKQAYDINKGNVTKGSLTTTRTYIVSLWAQPGAAPLINTLSFGAALFQRNGWNYYEKKIIPSTGTVTISGTGVIDELRLYPDGSQMKTFTYNPLIGITSQCDVNSNITYYQYDDLGRLAVVRDQDRNTVKRIYSNYAGQVENSNIWFNSAQSGTYQKTGCSGCQMGSMVTYSVAADVYSSSISPADADSKAMAEVTANGQAYANANGTCSAPGLMSLSGSNAISTKSFTVVCHNNCTGTNYTYTLNPGTSNVTLSPQLPVGNYNVSFTPAGGTGIYTYFVNGFSQHTTLGNILGVDITTSANQVRVTP